MTEHHAVPSEGNPMAEHEALLRTLYRSRDVAKLQLTMCDQLPRSLALLLESGLPTPVMTIPVSSQQGSWEYASTIIDTMVCQTFDIDPDRLDEAEFYPSAIDDPNYSFVASRWFDNVTPGCSLQESRWHQTDGSGVVTFSLLRAPEPGE